MKRSILVALGTSVFYWLIFTGFDYLAKVQKYKFSIFSPDRTIFGWSEAIVVYYVYTLTPWLIVGMLCALLIRDDWLTLFSPLIYLAASVFSFYATLHLPIPLRGDTYFPSLASVLLFVLRASFTFVRWLLIRKRKNNLY